MAQGIGLPLSVSRRLSQIAQSNSEEVKNHIRLVMAKADLSASEETTREVLTDSRNTHKERITYTNSRSTIEVTIKTNTQTDEKTIIVTRSGRFGNAPVEGLSYGEYERIINSNAQRNIDVNRDIVQPLMRLYGNNISRLGSESDSHSWLENMNSFPDPAIREQIRGPIGWDMGVDYARQSGANWSDVASNLGRSSGRRQRTKPLFSVKKKNNALTTKTVAGQIKELRQYENINSIKNEIILGEINIKTKKMKQGGICLGEFEIVIKTGLSSGKVKKVKIRRLPNNFYDGDDEFQGASTNKSNIWVPHPFVSKTSREGHGNLCFGNSLNMYEDAIHNEDYFTAVNIILEVLLTQTGSPYTNWDKYYKMIGSDADKIDLKKKKGGRSWLNKLFI